MLHLRNQFILAPIKLVFSDKCGIINQKHLEFYNLRSKLIGAFAEHTKLISLESLLFAENKIVRRKEFRKISN